MAGSNLDVTATPADAPAAGGAARSGLLDRPAPGTTAAARARAGRSDTLAKLISGKLDEATPSTAASEPAPARARQPALQDDETLDDGGGSEQPRGSKPAEERQPEKRATERKADDEKDDPETTRRVAKINEAEKRSRDKLAAERAELENADKLLEEKWAPRQKAVEEYEQVRATAKQAVNNPAKLAKLMTALGLTEDHYEPMAQVLYSMSKAGAADPARAAHVERIARERRQAEELEERDTTNASRIEKLEKKLEEKERAGEFAARQREYLDDAIAAIVDEFPIAASALDKTRPAEDATPDERKAAAARRRKLEQQLFAAAEDLHRLEGGDGPAPAPRDVIAHFEKLRGEQLDELGIARPTRDSKPTGKPADKKQPATTLSSDLSTARVPRPSLGGREHRAETRRMLEQGKLG